MLKLQFSQWKEKLSRGLKVLFCFLFTHPQPTDKEIMDWFHDGTAVLCRFCGKTLNRGRREA